MLYSMQLHINLRSKDIFVSSEKYLQRKKATTEYLKPVSKVEIKSPQIKSMLNITKVQLSASGWTLNILSTRVATITNPLGQRKVTYFGFETEEKALQFKRWLLENTTNSTIFVRKAERLSQNWECKCWNVPTELIIQIAELDISQQNQFKQ
ncbi:hypothetical protein DSM107003_36600 [Trichormus variabilis SAG 1403-4b]|uniref:Uncharacterized protein n=2 Tax=Anabaena variabilis TaxID=264691 RepID=A0A433UKY5_ANAVA|nr:hypothetical protein DSM107003_36600 [Trichormus variabilis SAG 1403-4b]